MANPEQLAKLNESIESWNQWRAGREFVPDLRGAALQGMDLSGANLRGADLRGAGFKNANLFRASLREANLQGSWRRILTRRGGYETAALAIVVGVLFGVVSWAGIMGVPSAAPIFAITAVIECLPLRHTKNPS